MENIPEDRTAPELLPCPFCGGVGKAYEACYGFYAACDGKDCNVMVGHMAGYYDDCGEFPCVDAAISAWNRRADLAAPSAPAEVEGLARWRIDHNGAHKDPAGLWVMEQDAATALTAQQAEIKRLRGENLEVLKDYRAENKRREKAEAENERLRASRFEVVTERNALQARAEKAEAERDAWKANAQALAKCAEDAQAYAKGWADADGGLDGCDIEYRSDYDRAMSTLAAYEKLKGEV